MPLASPEDRVTQIRWGIRDFEFHFNRKPEAIWLAETAINMDTIVDLIREGIRFTILSPTCAQSYRKIGETHWSDCSHTNIDTLRPYRIYPKDAEGKALCEGYLDIFFIIPLFLVQWDLNIFYEMPMSLVSVFWMFLIPKKPSLNW